MSPLARARLQELAKLLSVRAPSEEHFRHLQAHWKHVTGLSREIGNALKYIDELETGEVGARIGGLLSSIDNRDRLIARLEKHYEALAAKAELPIPPCPHGREARLCLRCSTSWLRSAPDESEER